MQNRRATASGLLVSARSRLCRLAPAEVAASDGLLLVDTRDSAARQVDGVIPGSLWLPRSVLPWRADPESELPDPVLTATTLRVVVACVDGYSSSLDAALLQDMGYRDATDMIGGMRLWKRQGLPLEYP